MQVSGRTVKSLNSEERQKLMEDLGKALADNDLNAKVEMTRETVC